MPEPREPLESVAAGPVNCQSAPAFHLVPKVPRLRSFSWIEKRSTRLPFSAFDRSFNRIGGLTIRQDHKPVGKVFVNVPANKSTV
jgi:hypothetical protein